MNDLDACTDAVDAGILARGSDRAGVDVARQHRPVQRLRRRDGEHAGAGADVEHGGLSILRRAARAERTGCAALAASSSSRCGRARAGSRAWCRDGRCRRRAPPRSGCRCGCARTPARSCAPCTTKRPASTGASPSRLLRTQSVGASVSNASACAAAAPATDAISARTAASSGRSRKWMREGPASVRFLEGRSGDLFGIDALGQRIGDFLGAGGIGREPCDHGGGGDGRRLKHGSVSSAPPRIRCRPAPAAASDSQPNQHPSAAVIHTIVHRSRGLLSSGFSQPVPGAGRLFCTGLSPALRSRGGGAKALDLPLE